MKEWLYEQYITNKLSTVKIAEIVGLSPAAIRARLIKYGIPVRNISDGQTINHEDYFVLNKDIITGCLLGDAKLVVNNKYSDISYPMFYKKNKYLDHVEYVAKDLFKENYKKRIFKVYEKKVDCYYYELRTLAKHELMPWQRAWYPESNNFKKLVPQEIIINNVVLLHWFLDDAYTIKIKGAKYRQVFGTFCSESFIKEDQERLCEQVNKSFNLDFHIVKAWRDGHPIGTGFRIRIPTYKLGDFYNIIGLSPFESLSYKWKNTDAFNEEGKFKSRFDLLNDKNWLLETSKTLSSRRIAAMVGCGHQTVLYAIKRHSETNN